MVSTGSSNSYSTATSAAARLAVSRSAAAIAAMGWPTYFTTPSARIGSPEKIGATSLTPGMSAPVIAALTPGTARAFAQSTERMRACGCGLVASQTSWVPGRAGMSSI